jgi:hypothetical protein
MDMTETGSGGGRKCKWIVGRPPTAAGRDFSFHVLHPRVRSMYNGVFVIAMESILPRVSPNCASPKEFSMPFHLPSPARSCLPPVIPLKPFGCRGPCACDGTRRRANAGWLMFNARQSDGRWRGDGCHPEHHQRVRCCAQPVHIAAAVKAADLVETLQCGPVHRLPLLMTRSRKAYRGRRGPPAGQKMKVWPAC